MEQPRISIITIVRNGAATIEKTLQSVQAQTYRNIEYIVLDAASTDGTQAIIERYRPIISIYHSRPDKGAYDATLQGLAMATGDMVGLLMADDWLSPDACETLAEMYRADPAAEIFCFGLQEWREKDGEQVKTRRFTDPPGHNFQLLDGLYCQGLNRFYRRDTFLPHATFKNDHYVQLADRELYIRLGRKGLRKSSTEKTLYHFLVHANSNSASGKLDRIVYFLRETQAIAADYLAGGSLTKSEKKNFKRWYCFNAVRLGYYQLKSGDIFGAVKTGIIALKYPLTFIRTFFDFRMPLAYRPVP